MEGVVELVAQKLSGSAGPGGTDSDSLQGCLLKFREHSKTLCIRVESFMDCLANQKPPWSAYGEFMSGRLIALDKLPGVCPVGVR